MSSCDCKAPLPFNKAIQLAIRCKVHTFTSRLDSPLMPLPFLFASRCESGGANLPYGSLGPRFLRPFSFASCSKVSPPWGCFCLLLFLLSLTSHSASVSASLVIRISTPSSSFFLSLFVWFSSSHLMPNLSALLFNKLLHRY